MKTKIFFFIAVALFYFATNISAQQVVYEMQKIGDDTVVVRQGQSLEKLGEFSCYSELVEKYGVKAAMHAYFSGKEVPVDYVQFTIYPSFGLIETEVTTTTFLIREGNTLVEKLVFAERQDTTVLFIAGFLSFLVFVLGYLLGSYFPQTPSKKKNRNVFPFKGILTAGMATIIFISLSILYFIRSGNSLPLCINVLCFAIGIVSGYLYNKKQQKKKAIVLEYLHNQKQ